jgi:hypothetical protein
MSNADMNGLRAAISNIFPRSNAGRDKGFLLAIMFLGALLRFSGIGWGIPSPAIPHFPFHPDEQWVMNILSGIDVRALHFDPKGAPEGALSFNIWTVTALFLKTLGITHRMPNELAGFGDKDYGTIMMYGRIVTACIDVLSIFLVFLILRVVVKGRPASLIGALLYSVIPFEIIYAHYMRGHVIANFFELLVIYFSVLVCEIRNKKYLYALIGMSLGLATAARFTTGIIVVVPIMMIFYRDIYTPQQKKASGCRNLPATAIAQIGYIGAFGFLGLFVGDPYLFLDYKSALLDISRLRPVVPVSEFRLMQLMDFSRLWVYLRQLIPYGTLPGLWIVFYASVVYLLFRKRYYQYTLPLIVLIPLYLYPMAKGYADPIFVRAVMFLFPVFAILSAIAIYDVFANMVKRDSLLRNAMLAVFVLVIGSTILYDIAYVTSMRKEDPRIQMYKYFNGLKVGKNVKIGMPSIGWCSCFLQTPTLNLLPRDKFSLVESDQFPEKGPLVDYLLLVAVVHDQQEKARNTIERLQESNRYMLERTFENHVSFLGVRFEYQNNPHDLQYPYPTLYLLRRLK